MSNYNTDPAVCRVDFFKPSGKWADTEAITFISYNGDIHDAFLEALEVLNGRYKNFQAVCLEPYHMNSHPISVIL